MILEQNRLQHGMRGTSVENEKPNIGFMMDYVKDYLDGKIRRFTFELEFKYFLLTFWNDMCEEDIKYASAFKYCIANNGFEVGGELSDAKYKELINWQYQRLERYVKKHSLDLA